ncbi:hypothetical protein Cgig2_020203 [Carnegiea gigantea]|uniref:Uncharacterized protein n=1 Tax=Carnegiea gigantea TaxID=171969 RepID=A0A9Q1KTC7_9CARY|nr:hypothetical protein Cgig2_020203 [Carnegiea gigantea]
MWFFQSQHKSKEQESGFFNSKSVTKKMGGRRKVIQVGGEFKAYAWKNAWIQVAILAADWEGDRSSWRRWEGREIVMYVLWGEMLVENGDEKVTYEGGSRKCMMVKEGMGVEELMKMVREMTGSDMSDEKLWYSLKYDRKMLVAVEGDSDVKVIFKGNNEHRYMYVAGNSGPVKRAQDRAAQLVRSGRKCDDGVEVGEEGGNNQVGLKRNCRSLGSEGAELPASRLRLGGDTIEMLDDDEISVASEDAGDEETTKEDDAGDEQAAEKRCDDGNKRKGFADGNDVNDNVGHLEKLGKKMDKYKTDILKWKNEVGERTEQKLADTYKKKWVMRGLLCCHAMPVIAKANYGFMTMSILFIRPQHRRSYITNLCTPWKRTTRE